MSVLKQRAVLLDSVGDEIPGAIPTSLGWSIDGGWDVAATFNQDFDPRQGLEAEMRVAIYDDANSPLTSPVLWAGQRGSIDSRSTSGGGMGSFSGWDRTSQKMRVANQSFPTFSATNSVALVGALTDRAGIAAISGLPNWYVHEEDVKQAKLSSFVLDRLLKLAAYDLVAKLDGTLEAIPWETTSGTLIMPWAKLETAYNPWEIRTGLRVGKFSSIPSTDEADNTYDFYESGATTPSLNTPVYGPTIIDSGLTEAFGAVTFLTDDDEVVAFYTFKPTLYSYSGSFNVGGIATKMTVIVDPINGSQTSNFPAAARLQVLGTPPGSVPDGVDREFINPAPTSGGPDVSLGDRPASEEYIDSLWPSESVAVARRPYCLAKLNGPHDSLTITRDILDTRPRLKQAFTYQDRLYQVVAINWNLTGYRTTCTLWRV